MFQIFEGIMEHLGQEEYQENLERNYVKIFSHVY